MTKGYYKAAWNDIKNSPGWFGKMCLLGLIYMIPVFGFMVMNGYLLGWSREIAWNINKPMPAKVFGNEDGKLYRRGGFSLVIVLVMSIIPAIIYGIASAIDGANYHSFSALVAILMILAAIASIFFQMVTWVSYMRMTLYDDLGAGFGFKKIWKMMDHDFTGLLRIFCISLILGLIVGLVFYIVIFAILIFGLVAGMGMYAGYSGSLSSADITGIILLCMSLLPLMLLLVYVGCVAEAFINSVVLRAVGYWTRNFQVDAWGDKDAPLPFETQAGQAAAAIATGVAAGTAAQPAAAPVAAPVVTPAPEASAPTVAPTPAPTPAPAPEAPAPEPAPAPAPAPEVPAPAPEAPTVAPAPEVPAAPAPEAPAPTPAPAPETPAAPAPAPEAPTDDAAPASDAAPADPAVKEGDTPTQPDKQ